MELENKKRLDSNLTEFVLMSSMRHYKLNKGDQQLVSEQQWEDFFWLIFENITMYDKFKKNREHESSIEYIRRIRLLNWVGELNNEETDLLLCHFNSWKQYLFKRGNLSA